MRALPLGHPSCGHGWTLGLQAEAKPSTCVVHLIPLASSRMLLQQLFPLSLHLQFPCLYCHSHQHTKMLDLKIKPSLDLTFPSSYHSTSLPSSSTKNERLNICGVSDPTLTILSWMYSSGFHPKHSNKVAFTNLLKLSPLLTPSVSHTPCPPLSDTPYIHLVAYLPQLGCNLQRLYPKGPEPCLAHNRYSINIC